MEDDLFRYLSQAFTDAKETLPSAPPTSPTFPPSPSLASHKGYHDILDPPEFKLLERWAYGAPHPVGSKDAHTIWLQCGFGADDHEEEEVLHRALAMWAEERCKIVRRNEVDFLEWRSPTGNKFTWSWPVFQKWFLCACGPLQKCRYAIDSEYFT